MSELTITRVTHNKDMARNFLSCLDPNVDTFTFQFFSDGKDRYAEIFHGTLDEVWPKVLALNTPQRGVGVFVIINETDLEGRRNENIVRVRALFADADDDEQVGRCLERLTACAATPTMIVKTGRGLHIYFGIADVLCDQFRGLQESLIDKLGTDPAVKDLPRVMRLPGTIHLKDPDDPRPVKLFKATSTKSWQLPELVAKLGLSTPANSATPVPGKNKPFDLAPAERERLQKLFGNPTDSLSDGLEANIEEIRSAVSAIPPSAFSTEPEWMKLARGLAHEAAVRKNREEQLWEILDNASRLAPGYDEADNRSRWLRYISEAFNREDPITIATVFDLAFKHGWQGWSPPTADCGGGNPSTAAGAAPAVWRPDELKVSFSNTPHRQWLYGYDLVRGELTVIGSPGGVGKSSLAIGIAISIATGRELIGEKIRGGNDLKVLLINAEDSGTEIKRRVWAFSLAHIVPEQDLNRLHVAGADDHRVQRLSFLRTNNKGASELDANGFAVLESALETLHPDVIVLDPLVAFCAGGNMNDNASMSLVMRGLKRFAAKYDCAVLIVHHTRKGGDVGNAESISGAAAIVNLARRAVMPVSMTEEEANKNGVLPSERFQYFKLIDAKSNLAPRSADAPWYQLHSVELPNPEPPIYPFGDNVQAITRAILPLRNNAAAAAEDQKIRRAILDLVHRGKMIDGQLYPYSPSLAGAENRRALLANAMTAVELATAPKQWKSGDLEFYTKHAIDKMKKENWFIIDDVEKLKPGAASRYRRGRGLAVDWARTPWPDGTSSVSDNEPTLDGGQLVNT